MKMGKLEKLFVNSVGHSKSVSLRAERLLRHAQPAPCMRYLDVGTGNGTAAIEMARTYGLHVTGVDVDTEQVRLARQAAAGMNNVHFLALDGRDLPFADASFDIVSAFRVTHHIAAWHDAVAEMLRVIRPGGAFIFSDLVLPAPLAAFAEKVTQQAGFPNVAHLTEIVTRHGFSPSYTSRGAVHFDAVYHRAGA